MKVNEKQKEAVLRARQAPEGLNIVIGPPGSGKTYLAIEMMTPFLLFIKTEDAIRHITKLKEQHPNMEKTIW
ncbi:hypothetical protein GJ744_009149 [Endocarpon pusillum]|uniref:Uncharacterized protein n=1 Tax=Endocarpon pusillum TaxID=364733 RepID=A0A8H7E4T6_9EURO|nr:hypothetical protein GJ744_009149 [Endocarpon pusillum]